MNICEKALRHTLLVLNHKRLVFKYCYITGIPFRGLVHDLSKFSPVEFFESIKYFTGTGSPITECKKDKGYSNAWLHHKGRNKHHFEYWVDTNGMPCLMPYEYVLEMCCDMLAAGKVYMKDKWTEDYPLEYWNKEKDIRNIHPVVKYFQTKFFETLKEGGFKELTKEKTKKIYKEGLQKYKKGTL